VYAAGSAIERGDYNAAGVAASAAVAAVAVVWLTHGEGAGAATAEAGAARGGGSILNEASAAAFRAADNAGSWIPKSKHLLQGGSQSKARFATSNFDEVRGIAQEALRSSEAQFVPNPNLPGTFRVVTNLARPVGVNGQQSVRVIVGLDGQIINAFPVHSW
jgi:hypothetical protein